MLAAADAFTNTDRANMNPLDEMQVTITHMLKSQENSVLDALRPTTFAFQLDENYAKKVATTRPQTRAAQLDTVATATSTCAKGRRLQQGRRGTQYTPLTGGAGSNNYFGGGVSTTPSVLSGSNWNPMPLSGKHVNS